MIVMYVCFIDNDDKKGYTFDYVQRDDYPTITIPIKCNYGFCSISLARIINKYIVFFFQ